jgi:hypothetical protein
MKAWLEYNPSELTFLRKLLTLLLFPSTIIGIWSILDFFSDPFAPSIYRSIELNSLLTRTFIPFMTVVLFIPLGFFIVRRVPSNIIGILLLQLGSLAPSLMLSYQSPPFLISLASIFVGFYWQCIFYVPVLFLTDAL